MNQTNALLVSSPTSKFEKGKVPLRPIGEDGVHIKILYSGICHSDIHQARNEWFEGIFPLVPGHEITGEVIGVGSNVVKFKVGDKVGVGTFVDSCRTCEYCLDGKENYCLKGNVQTYNGRHYDQSPTYGGYAKEIVVDQNYVLSIPEGLDMAAAAPLLCAGVTVYSPLLHWQAGTGKKVAVLGLGGLGHMAVKFAAAMGADVYVLGRSKAKADDAKAFGAIEYILTVDAVETHKNFFDIILNTTSSSADNDALLGMLRVGGSLVYVGLAGVPQSFDPFSLVTGLKSIGGSNTGNIAATQQMLDFCAKNNVLSSIELLDVTDAKSLDVAYDRVVASDVKYRFVIDASTI